MSEEKFYRCIPELNKECKKNNCYINGGVCESTIYKKYTLKGLLEENQRLNNIIKEANEKIHNILFNVSSKEHNLYLKLDETYQGKELLALLEIEGVDKE